MEWVTLKDRARFRLGDPSGKIWTDDDLLRYEREALGDLVSCKATLKRHNFAATTGTRQYTLPLECYEVYGVKCNGRRLQGTSNQRLEELDASYLTSTGQPEFYYLEDVQTISLYPVPSFTATYSSFVSELGEVVSLAEDGTYQTVDSELGVVLEIVDVTDGEYVAVMENGGVAIEMYSDGFGIEARYLYAPDDTDESAITVGPSFMEDAQLFFILWKALAKEGPGQNLRLAGWYKERYQDDAKIWYAKNRSTVHGQDQWMTQRPSSWGLDRMWRERTWR